MNTELTKVYLPGRNKDGKPIVVVLSIQRYNNIKEQLTSIVKDRTMTDIHVPPQYTDKHLNRSFKHKGTFAWYHCRVVQETETTIRIEYRYPFQRASRVNQVEWFYRDMIELV